MAFVEVLRDKGIRIEAGSAPQRGRSMLAEHVSPPVSEEVKVMLKISSNIHTVMWPHVIGAIGGRDPNNAKAVYERHKRELFTRAGADPDAPGVSEGKYSADFFVRFLTYVARQPYFRTFRLALPIMSIDGSLGLIEPGSPAAGRVFAKTGTGVGHFAPGTSPRVVKALAGYIHLHNGQWVTFAQFMEAEVDSIQAGSALATKAGQAMGEIATAVFLSCR